MQLWLCRVSQVVGYPIMGCVRGAAGLWRPASNQNVLDSNPTGGTID